MMPEKEPLVNPAISEAVADMFEDCRNNMPQDSPSSIKVKIGEADWALLYWPESTHRQGEVLDLLRGWLEFENPKYYRILPTARITKNEETPVNTSEKVEFDNNGEELVQDIDEVFMLKAIVKAAIELKK